MGHMESNFTCPFFSCVMSINYQTILKMENPYFFSLLVSLILVLFSGILLLILILKNSRAIDENLKEEEQLKHITRRKEAAHRATQEYLKIKEELDYKTFIIDKMALDKKYHSKAVGLRNRHGPRRNGAKVAETAI